MYTNNLWDYESKLLTLPVDILLGLCFLLSVTTGIDVYSRCHEKSSFSGRKVLT